MLKKFDLLLISAAAVVVLFVGLPAVIYIGWQLTNNQNPPSPVIIPPSGGEPSPTSPAIRASISGFLWHDLCDSSAGSASPGCVYTGQVDGYKANGMLEAGEPGIGGAQLSIGAGACPSTGMGGVTTGPDGSFVFNDLNPGSYCISIDPTAGSNSNYLIPGSWTFPPEAAAGSLASRSIMLMPGQALSGVNFGWDYQFLPVPEITPVPTNTPVPTLVPTPTPLPVPCDWAGFVADVTVPDGAVYTAGTVFTKTWRLKNLGSCSWNTDYDLVFVSGDAMTKKTIVPLSAKVAPGATVDLSVKLTAPNKAGTYLGYWMLRNASGSRFGIGYQAKDSVWVKIKVVKPNPDFAYDFAANFCAAKWSSKVGPLPCPGSSSSEDGFVQLLNKPALENRQEDEPALWVHPNNEIGGKITGVFPAYTVQDGDHFIAAVGCLDDSKGCNVTFRLLYRVGNNPLSLLGAWDEVYDGSITLIDLDLSTLAGQNVSFVLIVKVRGGNPVNANAFWFVPRIENLP